MGGLETPLAGSLLPDCMKIHAVFLPTSGEDRPFGDRMYG